MRAIGDGTDTPAMRQELLQLEEEKARLEASAGRTEPDNVEKLFPNLARLYRETVEDLQEELARDDGPAGRPVAQDFAAARSLIERIVVNPGDHHKARCGLELHGSLVNLLEGITPEEQRRNAADLRGLRMVAGEGLEPPTRGL